MQKKKLIVLSDWTEPKEKSWSGTTWSLTQALTDFFDIEIKNLNLGKFFHNLDRFASLPVIGLYFGALYDFLLKVKANWITRKDRTIPVFEICQDIELKNPYFTYQDMNYESGLWVKEEQNRHPYLYEAAGNNRLPKYEIDRRIKRQIKEYKNAKAVFFMGKWVQVLMQKRHPNLSNIYHIGGGTNLEPSRVKTGRKKGNKFLFVGRDFVRKDGPLVLDAFRLLQQRYPNLELHISGPNKDPRSSEDKNVFYYGDTSYDETTELMNECDVFVMPSRFEAYGLVFIEAHIFGLPCIGRNYFEMPYFIEEGVDGELLYDESAQELSAKMEKAIFDDKMKAQTIANRSKYISEYCWKTVAERASKIISQVLY